MIMETIITIHRKGDRDLSKIIIDPYPDIGEMTHRSKQGQESGLATKQSSCHRQTLTPPWIVR